MKKILICFAGPLLAALALCGCSTVGNKAASMSAIYGVMAVLSLVLLVGYCYLIRKKDVWFLLLFGLVTVVNAGYFSLSIATTLEEALLANRISYLGSVFLPMTMLLIILNVTKLRVSKWMPGILFGIGLAVFGVAASPGFLDIYYKEVSLAWVNGVAVLNKVYGPWHGLYPVYLLLYFGAIISAICHAAIRKKLVSRSLTVILAVAAFVNMGVWLMEQLVKIDFELLSVSYVISELFLLCLYLMLQESEKAPAIPAVVAQTSSPQAVTVFTPPEDPTEPDDTDPLPVTEAQPGAKNQALSANLAVFLTGLSELTYTERLIYDLYLEEKTTRQIMATLNIKENTLKFHNKNLYSKLGVSSRKQLIELARVIEAEKTAKQA